MTRICCLFSGTGILLAAWVRWPDPDALSFKFRELKLHTTLDELQTLHAGYRVRIGGIPYRLEWFQVTGS